MRRLFFPPHLILGNQHETHLSTFRYQTQTHPRLFGALQNTRWSRRFGGTPCQRSQTFGCVIGLSLWQSLSAAHNGRVLFRFCVKKTAFAQFFGGAAIGKQHAGARAIGLGGRQKSRQTGKQTQLHETRDTRMVQAASKRVARQRFCGARARDV